MPHFQPPFPVPLSLAYPSRIVCLTEETTEILYELGEEWRIAGISGFTVRPPRARREKPKVSAFTSARIDKILALEPDLVLGFSDLQAEIAQTLIKAGIETYVFNQRSVSEILRTIQVVGDLVGAHAKAAKWVSRLSERLAFIRDRSHQYSRRPRVYFEEWPDNPMISGIRWVSELVSIAGGDDIFPELAKEPLGRNRIIHDPGEIIRRQPDIILASWCGRRVHTGQIATRAGWGAIPAVQDGQIFEIKSSIILQPGPASLTEGLDALVSVIDAWQQQKEQPNGCD